MWRPVSAGKSHSERQTPRRSRPRRRTRSVVGWFCACSKSQQPKLRIVGAAVVQRGELVAQPSRLDAVVQS